MAILFNVLKQQISQIDINNPDMVINVKDLKTPNEAYHPFADDDIRSYAYAFRHNGEIMKIGESDPSTDRQFGERVARQVANLPGWSSYPFSSCGMDMQNVVKAFENRFEKSVHKDEVSVDVWILDDIENPKGSKHYVTKKVEDYLLDQYESAHGQLPPGNPKDTRSKWKTSAEAKFEELFMFDFVIDHG